MTPENPTESATASTDEIPEVKGSGWTRWIIRLVWLVGLVALAIAGWLAYVWFSGGSGEPSAEVTAPTLATVPAAASAEGGGGQVVFEIDKTSSEVRFEIDETLRGSPFRVVGTTSEVAGQIRVDFDDPPASEVGEIVINVRTLDTDDSLRDRAIRGRILGANDPDNEFARFVPAAVEGIPDQIAPGDAFPVSITGDFTLSGATRPVTFQGQVTLTAPDRLSIEATATVLHADFNLNIPEIPIVANVSEEVLLAVTLVALAPSSQ